MPESREASTSLQNEPVWMFDDEQLSGTLRNESLHTGRNVMVRDDRDRKLLARAAARIDYLSKRDGLALTVMEDLDGLATGSEGIVGWHMNGDVLPWAHVECLTALGEWLSMEPGAQTR